MIKFKFESGGVPVGSYSAKFIGVEPTEPNEYGAGLRWVFEIGNGAYAGQRASRITSPKPTPLNACGKVISGLMGKAFGNGDEVDLTPCVGKTYLIVVGQSQGGATRVETVAQLPV